MSAHYTVVFWRHIGPFYTAQVFAQNAALFLWFGLLHGNDALAPLKLSRPCPGVERNPLTSCVQRQSRLPENAVMLRSASPVTFSVK